MDAEFVNLISRVRAGEVAAELVRHPRVVAMGDFDSDGDTDLADRRMEAAGLECE
jgi:hypothetical protein